MNLQNLCPKITSLLNQNNIIVLDAGCAGSIDQMLNELCQQNFCRAYGFEANTTEFEKINAKNTQANIKLYNLALFDKDGTIDFHDHSTVSSVFRREDREEAFEEAFEIKSMRCAKISTLASEGTIEKIPDFIKLDVEGSEIPVLRGLENGLDHEVLGIKTEFDFQSKQGTNNFGEIHLMLIQKGFRLMDICYNSNPILGLSGGDALYLKRPDAIIAAEEETNKKLLLLKLVALSYYLQMYEVCSLIAELSQNILDDEERAEIEKIAYAKIYFPKALPFAFPKPASVFFMLSQILIGNKGGKKSLPMLNRLGRMKPLFISPNHLIFNYLKARQKRFLGETIKRYLIRIKHGKLDF